MKTSIDKLRLYDVLLSPVITEKSKRIEEANGELMFNVAIKSTKKDIKQAVEMIFNVKVLAVNTLIRKGKQKVFKGRIGKRSDVKKAFVKLAEGSQIDFGQGV